MDPILDFLRFFIYFGAEISLLYCFLELVRKSPRNPLLAFLLFLTTTSLFRYGLYLDRNTLEYPYAFLFLFSGITLVGPLIFVYISTRLEPEGESGFSALAKRYWFHFLPALFLGIGEGMYFTQGREELLYTIRETSKVFRWDLIHGAAFLASVQVSVYSLACLYIYHKVSRKYEIYELKLVWVILLLPVIANTLIGPAYFLKSDLLFALGASAISCIVILLFTLRERHPDFFHQMREVIRNAKYQNTNLNSEEVEKANEKIRVLLEERGIYKDSELRLGDLAAELDLSSHQTSRYLNEVHGETFSEWINRHRIREACRLLISDPKKPVLDIGFEVGYNSKSAFNSQFVKLVGVSPAMYRKAGPK